MIGTDTPFPDGSYLHGGPYALAELRERFPDLTDTDLDLRRRCVADPLFLAAEVVFGDMPRASNLFLVPPSQHREVAQAMIDQASCLYVDHRGTLKTTLQDHVGSVWQLLKYVNDRILFLQSVVDVAKQISRVVRGTYEKNKALRKLFPEYAMQRSDDGNVLSWSVPCRTRVTVEGSFTVGTPETSLTGLHFEVIKATDLMNTSTVPPPCGLSTVEKMKTIIAWYASTDGLLVHKSQCPRAHKTYNSNRWHDGDHVAQIKRGNNGYFRIVERGVKRGDDGTFIPTWPECADAAQLAEIRSRPSMTAATFAANFCSDPLPEGGSAFLRPWFKTYREIPGDLVIAITCDPAFTEATSSRAAKSDRSGFVVSGVSATTKDLYVLEIRAGRWGPDDCVEQMFQLASFWSPSWVGYEDTGSSRALVAILLARMQRTGQMLPYRAIKMPGSLNKTSSKEARIGPLHAHAQHFGVFVHEDERHEELVEELLRFGVAEHDDLADALGMRAMDLYAGDMRSAVPEAAPMTFVPGRKLPTGDEVVARAIERSRMRGAPPWAKFNQGMRRIG